MRTCRAPGDRHYSGTIVPGTTARPANPLLAEFAGNSPARIAKRLFHATRPRFFPASGLPVLVGTAWGVQVSGQFDATVFALALLATVCVHAGSNVIKGSGACLRLIDLRLDRVPVSASKDRVPVSA